MGFFDFFGSMRGMKYRTEWNLGLLYKSEKDPQIEKDLKDLEVACAQFEKKYKGKSFFESSKKLHKSLQEYQALSDPRFYKASLYFFLRKEINANDVIAQAYATKIEKRIVDANSKVNFFVLSLAKIPKNLQITYLKDKYLKEFHYFLKKIFETAKHNLSDQEEQLLLLLTQTSETMWANLHQKILGNQNILFKNKEITLSEARARLSTLPMDDRYKLATAINEASKKIASISEAELNAIYTFHNIVNERKKFPKPYSASVLSKENSDKEIEDFTKIISTNFFISHRFYKLHAKLLKVKNLQFADRRVNIGVLDKKFNFEQSQQIVVNALSRAGSKFGELLKTFLSNGQIDVFPRTGKQAGGFHMNIGTLPSYILLNHVDNIESVETLAHEMGHAIHAELSKKQPRHYQEQSLATAEVASIFFEQFVSLEIEPNLSDKEKIIVLHRKICEDMMLVFVQIACFNYELELHELVKTHGQLNAQQMAKLMQKHMQTCFGKAMKITEDDGYLFVTWHHLRYNFYTYTYAYGGLISRTLFENWKKDPSYIKKIEQFLSAGGSMSPKDIFKSIGIKTDKAFFEAGLKAIEADIDRLEKLAKKQKLIK